MSRLANRLAPDPVILSVPLPGSCRVQNSPANRVPSHGTDAFGSSYAIDLVPVDAQERSAPRTWRRLIAVQQVVDHEPPELAGRDRDNDHIRLLGYQVVHASTTATGLAVAMTSLPAPRPPRRCCRG
jgi:hypothetical protein